MVADRSYRPLGAERAGGGPPVGTRWWADAYTPWQPEGAIGTEILDAAASASGSLVVHQGLASRADGPAGRGVSDG